MSAVGIIANNFANLLTGRGQSGSKVAENLSHQRTLSVPREAKNGAIAFGDLVANMKPAETPEPLEKDKGSNINIVS